jgi:hypothetical protein
MLMKQSAFMSLTWYEFQLYKLLLDFNMYSGIPFNINQETNLEILLQICCELRHNMIQ